MIGLEESRVKIALGLKQLRLKESISQEQFYKETNINIGKLESGMYDIQGETVATICSYFHISLWEFYRHVASN